ncbi:CLUMA_CG017629, isoform A [Clunio marinus]|uniref:CLUMA_CG017629, isoform A n=1 Tax=Clunio marinus TaxID=568069 RepID=A0A1J1IZG4_9DIPT|nr:CLUMA_CG017629, isoform A [Clunio marinus]
MTVNTREIIEAVSIVTDNHDIRVTVKSSAQASLTVAGFTFAGAFILGPLGIPIGATAGGLYAYSKSKGTFKSAAVVIKEEMTDHEKERLCGHVVEAFKNFSAEDVAMLVPLLMTSDALQKIIVTQVMQFLKNELRMQII